jgi:hypothetical protein
VGVTHRCEVPLPGRTPLRFPCPVVAAPPSPPSRRKINCVLQTGGLQSVCMGTALCDRDATLSPLHDIRSASQDRAVPSASKPVPRRTQQLVSCVGQSTAHCCAPKSWRCCLRRGGSGGSATLRVLVWAVFWHDRSTNRFAEFSTTNTQHASVTIEWCEDGGATTPCRACALRQSAPRLPSVGGCCARKHIRGESVRHQGGKATLQR